MPNEFKPTRVTTVMPHRLSDGAIVDRADRRTAGTGTDRLPQTRTAPQPKTIQSDAGAFRRELERRLAQRAAHPAQAAPIITTGANVTFQQQQPKPKTPNYGEPEEGVGSGRVPPGGVKMR